MQLSAVHNNFMQYTAMQAYLGTIWLCTRTNYWAGALPLPINYYTLWYCHCTARHCTAVQSTALHCTALQCTALHCTVLHCTALHSPSICLSPAKPQWGCSVLPCWSSGSSVLCWARRRFSSRRFSSLTTIRRQEEQDPTLVVRSLQPRVFAPSCSVKLVKRNLLQKTGGVQVPGWLHPDTAVRRDSVRKLRTTR